MWHSYPTPNAPVNIMTDASDVDIGEVLHQYLVVESTWRTALSYLSRKLSPTEQWYSTYGCELLAVYCAIRHFRHFLEAREFHVLTDHKPLTHSLKSKPDRHSPHQVHHSDLISQFTSDIRHVAEASAMQLDHTQPSTDFETLDKAQPNDDDLDKLHSATSTLKLEDLFMPMCSDTLHCDTSTGTPRPYVPEHFCHIVLNSLHAPFHQGVWATQWLVTVCFFWPGMNPDV